MKFADTHYYLKYKLITCELIYRLYKSDYREGFDMTGTVIAAALSSLIGYFLGCSNMAYYLSRLAGVDIRNTGSKNLGTCNAFVNFGFLRALFVFLHDTGKAVLAVVLCRLLFPSVPMIGYVAGTAAVIGHIFPFYLKFKGGKGFAAFLGMTAILDWRFFLTAAVALVLLTLITNYIVVGTVVVAAAFPIVTALATHSAFAAVASAIAAAVIIFRHRENIIRVLKGTEVGVLHRKEK